MLKEMKQVKNCPSPTDWSHIFHSHTDLCHGLRHWSLECVLVEKEVNNEVGAQLDKGCRQIRGLVL